MKEGRGRKRNVGKGMVRWVMGTLALTAIVGYTASAGAATFSVNSVADKPDDNPGDGVCAATIIAANPELERNAIVRCTLRAAVMEANALLGADQINLRRATYRLSYGGHDPETAAAVGDLDIVDKVVIKGMGRDLTKIDGSRLHDRIFDIHGPGVVVMSGMSLIGGTAMGAPLDQIRVAINAVIGADNVCPVVKPPDGADGGAILNRGAIVQLSDMYFEANKALCDGGAIDSVNDAIMTMKNCDFAYNAAIGNGGAVENDEDSIMAINTADFQWNNAEENGGALANDDSLLMLTAATMTFNAARGYGGGIWNGDSDYMTLRNINITYNDAYDGGGIFNDDGFLFFSGIHTVEYNSPNDIVDYNVPEDLPALP